VSTATAVLVLGTLVVGALLAVALATGLLAARVGRLTRLLGRLEPVLTAPALPAGARGSRSADVTGAPGMATAADVGRLPVPASAAEPGAAEPGAAEPGAAGPGTAGPTTGSSPRLSDVAAVTLGPPLIRLAALGYGVRTVVAGRVDRARR